METGGQLTAAILLGENDHCCGTATEVEESGPTSQVLRMRCQQCGSWRQLPLTPAPF